MRNFIALFFGILAWGGSTGIAFAYPSAGAEPAEGCRACHVNSEFRDKLVVKLLRVKNGKEVVNDYHSSSNTILDRKSVV